MERYGSRLVSEWCRNGARPHEVAASQQALLTFSLMNLPVIACKMYKPPHLPAAKGGDEASNFDSFDQLGPLRHPFVLTSEQHAYFAAF